MRSAKMFFSHYFSTLGLFVLGWIFYSISPFFSSLFISQYTFEFSGLTITFAQVFLALLLGYALILIPYYLSPQHESTAFLLLQALREKEQDTKKIKQYLLQITLKTFFVPTMIGFFIGNLSLVVNGISRLSLSIHSPQWTSFFYSSWALLALNLLLLLDVSCFLFGYLTESKALKNTIKSVDPSLFGWAVCVLCYPPFSNLTTNLVGWGASETVSIPSHPTLQIILNVLLLSGMAFYTWASISLGFKASNLTSRGVVSTGAYALVRHPAYAGKNFAWWISILPIAYLHFLQSPLSGLTILLSGICWTFLYHLRAITEERHLTSTDPDYLVYRKQTPFRYIP